MYFSWHVFDFIKWIIPFPFMDGDFLNFQVDLFIKLFTN